MENFKNPGRFQKSLTDLRGVMQIPTNADLETSSEMESEMVPREVRRIEAGASRCALSLTNVRGRRRMCA